MLAIFCASFNLQAQNDAYYNTINTGSSAFVSDLKARIRSPYTRILYGDFASTNIANYASYLISGTTRGVICVYSGWEYQYTGTFGWTVMSREHTWCQSWMPVGGSGTDQYQDQHHLFPLNQNSANGVRSNHPLGIVTNVTSQFYDGKYGTNASGKNVYEPRRVHKGDAARALLYMCVRYDDIGGYTWNFNWLNNFLPTVNETTQDLNTLLQWHKDDPPDKWEVERNNYIESIQKNRNPFIDHPEYVNYINFNDLTKLSPVYSTEPTNYLSNFTSSVSSNAITLNWTDAAAGTQAPSGYLIEAFSRNNYFLPIDGSVYTDDTSLDSIAVVNVLYSGADTYTFSGLTNNKTYYFRVYSYNGDGTSRNYKTTGTVPSLNATTGSSVPATEPSNYVTNLSTGSIITTGIALSWTDASGATLPSGYLILANTNNTFTAPTDGTVYTDDATLSDGSAVINTAYGTTQYTFSSLNPSTTYYFKVYSYNGAGASRNYKTDGTPPSASGTTLTPVLSAEPTNYVTNLSTSNVTSSAVTLTWSGAVVNSQLPSGYLILGSTTNSFTVPTDGVVYADDPLLAEGSAVINAAYGTTQYTFSSLNSSTQYYFQVYSYNGDGTSRNYKTDGTVPSVNATTLAGSQITTLAGWDFSALTGGAGNFGASPLVASSQNANVTVGGLSRGSGFGTLSGTAAGSAWGANNFTLSGTFDGEITANKYFTFTISSNTNYNLSVTEIAAYNIRRSGGGPTTGQWQYKVGTGSFINIGSAITWGSTTTSSGNPQTAIDLSGITDLQNVFAGTTVTFRLVMYGATSTTGTEYFNDMGNTTTNDLIINGRVENTLPVRLLSFISSANNRDVKLNWTTISEINNAGFDVERTISGKESAGNWEKVGFVKGKGNTGTPTNYSFNDSKLNSGKYKYRLKQIDYNGNYEYYYLSNEVEIAVPKKFSMSQNYPNPFNPVTKIEYEIPVNSFVKLTVYDVMGREIETLVNKDLKSGMYEAVWNASNYSSGIYFARIEAGSFTKNIKLLLVK